MRERQWYVLTEPNDSAWEKIPLVHLRASQGGEYDVYGVPGGYCPGVPEGQIYYHYVLVGSQQNDWIKPMSHTGRTRTHEKAIAEFERLWKNLLQQEASERLAARLRAWANTDAARHPRPSREARHEYFGHRWGAVLAQLDTHAHPQSLLETFWRTAYTRERQSVIQNFSSTHPHLYSEVFNRCDCCDAQALHGQLRETNAGDKVCEICLDAYYVYSDIQDEYIRGENAEHFYTDLATYQRRDYSLVESDWLRGCGTDVTNIPHTDAWAYSDVADEIVEWICEFQPGDGGDDDDDDENSGLYNYHNSPNRVFHEVNSDRKRPAIGAEIELYCEDRRDVVRALRKLKPGLFLERDGSLDGAYGFEAVTQPMGETEWREYAPALLNVAKAYGAQGYMEGYGIHLNVHRNYLTSLQEARMVMFLEEVKNAPFVRAIAQRAALYEASFGRWRKEKLVTLLEFSRKTAERAYAREGAMVNTRNRYSPLNLKSRFGTAEFRLFQSTTYLPSFMKNLEFVWALIEWTSTKSATGTSIDPRDFVSWLASREKEFPHLVAFLRKPSFGVKGTSQRIPNTWLGLLPSPTTQSKDTVIGVAEEYLAA
ncbi:MAG: amidoligase family protein [Azoarcus sp.]|jgi:hypothetical protein|nr:amidoligase family protein [Azoarcus sp.]